MTIVFALLLTAFGVSASDAEKWSAYVPESGQAKAEIMVLGPAPEVQAVAQKVQIAVAQNQEWFRDYIRNADPTVPLPWHENLGVSEKEYQAFLTAIEEIELVKVGETDLVFGAEEGQLITLSGLPLTPPHDSLSYDPDRDVVITGYGELTDFASIDQDNPDSATGRWSGLQWSLERGQSTPNPLSVKFAIGQMKDSDRKIIYYDVSYVSQGGPVDYSFVLLY